ncbi:MAG: periplasmic heavy metal sensor [Pseudomonadota bacterium]
MSETPPPPKGTGRGTRVALYLSLAFNLLVIGLVLGALVTQGQRAEDRRPPAAGEFGFGAVIAALAPVERRALGREMRRALRAEGRTRGALRAQLDGVVAALRADSFAPEAVSALLDVQLSEAEFRLALARDLFVARLAAMDAAERAAFADRLEAELARMRGPRGARGPDAG